jgi:two-component system sensor histidine kinase KdpD
MDGVLIEQVLLNLLDNALKYAPADSAIQVSARPTDGSVTIEVSDHGSGIPGGDEERIFDKFYRAAPAGTTGVGLGLTVSRGIITAHGGRMWAENLPERGAVFRFTLPLERDTGQLSDSKTEAPPNPNESGA